MIRFSGKTCRRVFTARKLVSTFDKVMEPVSTFFKEEKQPIFKRGELKGRQETLLETAKRLKKSMKLSVEEIAEFTELPVKVIEELKP